MISAPLQPPDKILQSLLALREEMLNMTARNIHEDIILYKINSCLFSKYPHSFQEVTQK
jgi:hypothetical protein